MNTLTKGKIKFGTEIQTPGGVTITKQGEMDMEDQVIPEEELCSVGTSLGRTRNTGNYESIKFSVWASCPTKLEDMDSNYEKMKKFCDDKMVELNTEITNDLQGD